MKTTSRIVECKKYLAPLAAFCCLSLTQQLAQAQNMPASAASTMSHSMTSQDMKSSMMADMDMMHKMPMSGDIDKDFAMMMKMHHQQGVKMAQMQVMHGKSPAMKKMAKSIISMQNKEISQFDQWLNKQK